LIQLSVDVSQKLDSNPTVVWTWFCLLKKSLI